MKTAMIFISILLFAYSSQTKHKNSNFRFDNSTENTPREYPSIDLGNVSPVNPVKPQFNNPTDSQPPAQNNVVQVKSQNKNQRVPVNTQRDSVDQTNVDQVNSQNKKQRVTVNSQNILKRGTLARTNVVQEMRPKNIQRGTLARTNVVIDKRQKNAFVPVNRQNNIRRFPANRQNNIHSLIGLKKGNLIKQIPVTRVKTPKLLQQQIDITMDNKNAIYNLKPDWISKMKETAWENLKPQNFDILERLLRQFIETDDRHYALIVFAEDYERHRSNGIGHIKAVLENKSVDYNLLVAENELELILILSYLKLINRKPNIVISDDNLYQDHQPEYYQNNDFMNFLERLVFLFDTSLSEKVRRSRSLEVLDHQRGSLILDAFIKMEFLRREDCVMASDQNIETFNHNVFKFNENAIRPHLIRTIPAIARKIRKF